MKTATPSLVAHLSAVRVIRCADLIAIKLANGTTYRYNNRGLDLSADGYTWTSGTPLIKRTGTRRTMGIEVGTMTLTVTYRPGDMLGAVPWSSISRLGVLDGAEVTIRRGYWTDWIQAAVGTLHVFDGRVSEIEGGTPEVRITLRSATELFNQKLPRQLYQAACRNRLYDATTCKAAKVETNGTAQAGATRVSITTGLANPAGWFTGGVIRGLTGANAGVKRGVKDHRAGGVFVVSEPWPTAPAAGDTFAAAPGCDRTRDTCQTKFSNSANYRAEPYTPSPETTL